MDRNTSFYSPNAFNNDELNETNTIQNVKFGFISDKTARINGKFSCNIPDTYWKRCLGYTEDCACYICRGTGANNCRTHEGVIELPFGPYFQPCGTRLVEKIVKTTCCLCSQPLVSANCTGTGSVTSLKTESVLGGTQRTSAYAPLKRLWLSSGQTIYEEFSDIHSDDLDIPYDQFNLDMVLYMLQTPLAYVIQRSFKQNSAPIAPKYVTTSASEQPMATASVVEEIYCARGERRDMLRQRSLLSQLPGELSNTKLHKLFDAVPPEPNEEFPIQFHDTGDGNLTLSTDDLLSDMNLQNGMLPFLPTQHFSRVSIDEGKFQNWKRCIRVSRVTASWNETTFSKWVQWGESLTRWYDQLQKNQSSNIVREYLLGNRNKGMLYSTHIRLPLVLLWARIRLWACGFMGMFTPLGLLRWRMNVTRQLRAIGNRRAENQLWRRTTERVQTDNNYTAVNEMQAGLQKNVERDTIIIQKEYPRLTRILAKIQRWWFQGRYELHVLANKLFLPSGAIIHTRAERLFLEKWFVDNCTVVKRGRKRKKPDDDGKSAKGREPLPAPSPSRWGVGRVTPAVRNWLLLLPRPRVAKSDTGILESSASDREMPAARPPGVQLHGRWHEATAEEVYEIFALRDPKNLAYLGLAFRPFQWGDENSVDALKVITRNAPSLKTWREDFARIRRICKWMTHEYIRDILNDMPPSRRPPRLVYITDQILSGRRPVGVNSRHWRNIFSCTVRGIMQPAEVLAAGPYMHTKNATYMRLPKLFPILSSSGVSSEQLITHLERVRSDCTVQIRPTFKLTCEPIFGGCGAMQWHYHDKKDLQQVMYLIFDAKYHPHTLHPELSSTSKRPNSRFITVTASHAQEMLHYTPRSFFRALGITKKHNDPRNIIRQTIIWPPVALTLASQEVNEYTVRTGGDNMLKNNYTPDLALFAKLAKLAVEHRKIRDQWEATHQRFLTPIDALHNFNVYPHICKLVALCLGRRQQINKIIKLPQVVGRQMPFGEVKAFWGETPTFGDRLYGKDGHLRDNVLRRTVNGSAWATLGHSPSQQTSSIRVCPDFLSSSQQSFIVTEENIKHFEVQCAKIKAANEEHTKRRQKMVSWQLIHHMSAWGTEREQLELAGTYAWGCNVLLQPVNRASYVNYRSNRFSRLQPGDKLIFPARDGTILTCVRHPVLNDNSIQCVSVEVDHQQRGFQIATLTCQPIAGDADGDSLNVNNHMGDCTGDWGKEAAVKFGSHTHATRDLDGGTLYSITQDGLLGASILSRYNLLIPHNLFVSTLEKTLQQTQLKHIPCGGQPNGWVASRCMIEAILPPGIDYCSFQPRNGVGVRIVNSKFVSPTESQSPPSLDHVLSPNTPFVVCGPNQGGFFTSQDLDGQPGSLCHLIAHLCGRASLILFVERLYRLCSITLQWFGVGLNPSDCIFPFQYHPQIQGTDLKNLVQNWTTTHGKELITASNTLAMLNYVGCKASISDLTQMTVALGQQAQSGKTPTSVFGRYCSEQKRGVVVSPEASGYISRGFQQGLRPRMEIMVHAVSAISKERASSLSVSAPGSLQQKMTWALSKIRAGVCGSLYQINHDTEKHITLAPLTNGWQLCMLVPVQVPDPQLLQKRLGAWPDITDRLERICCIGLNRERRAWLPCDPQRVLQRTKNLVTKNTPLQCTLRPWNSNSVHQLWHALIKQMSLCWGGGVHLWLSAHPYLTISLLDCFTKTQIPGPRVGYLFTCAVLARYKRALEKPQMYVGQRRAGQLAKKILQMALDVRHAKNNQDHQHNSILKKIGYIMGTSRSVFLQWMTLHLRQGTHLSHYLHPINKREFNAQHTFFRDAHSMPPDLKPANWMQWIQIDDTLIKQPLDQSPLPPSDQPLLWITLTLPPLFTAEYFVAKSTEALPEEGRIWLWHAPRDKLKWVVVLQLNPSTPPPIERVEKKPGVGVLVVSHFDVQCELKRIFRFWLQYLLPHTTIHRIDSVGRGQHKLYLTPRRHMQFTPPSVHQLLRLMTGPNVEPRMAGNAIGCPSLVGKIFGVHALQRCLWMRLIEAFSFDQSVNSNIVRILSRVMSFYGVKGKLKTINETETRKLLQGRNHTVGCRAAVNSITTHTKDGFNALMFGCK